MALPSNIRWVYVRKSFIDCAFRTEENVAAEQLGMSTGSTEPELNSYWFTSDHLVSLSLDKYGKVAVDFCSNQGARKEHSPSYATEEQRRVEQKDQDLVRLDLVIMTLRSSAFITDGSGVAIQHLEYMAFGEVFVDQRRTGFGTPYKFNAKELDCESGYYYYSARYYDPRMARFLSVDPLAGEMPEWGSYTYTFNNPLKYIDPTGMGPENIGVDGKGNVVFDDGKNDGNLYLVNPEAGELNSLEDLRANSTQLTQNHEWVGSEDEMINYVKSQWSKSGNGMDHLLSVIDIRIGKNKSGFAVNAFKGREIASGKREENANTLDKMYLKINYKPEQENHHLSNPYNTRNALTHEKQHLMQGLKHKHRDLGWTPRTTGSIGARELEAIQVQKSMPSWNNTTPVFKSAISAYEKRWQ